MCECVGIISEKLNIFNVAIALTCGIKIRKLNKYVVRRLRHLSYFS